MSRGVENLELDFKNQTKQLGENVRGKGRHVRR